MNPVTSSGSLLFDAQGPWWEFPSPIPIPNGQLPAYPQQGEGKTRKYRGNRADQHFRRRLRARNLDQATMASLIHARMEQEGYPTDNEKV